MEAIVAKGKKKIGQHSNDKPRMNSETRTSFVAEFETFTLTREDES